MNESTVDILRKFAHSRPNLEPGNYCNASEYRKEARAISRQLKHAREILNACEKLGVGSDAWRDAMANDRLQIVDGEIDFVPCQYFPTEYRRAVCRVGMCAILSHFRKVIGCKTREDLQLAARVYLPLSLRRWFN